MSIITLNVNGLNAPTKRHRLAEWVQKEDPYICCLQENERRRKGEKRPTKTNPKQLTKWQ